MSNMAGVKDVADAVAALRANVPVAMRELKQWLVYKFEQGAHDKKPRKVPYYVSGSRRTGEQGSDSDRAALATFEAAIGVLEAARCSGVGFAFLPGDGLVGIDIDGQIDENGTPSERTRKIIEACASYTEFSPSRRGVHIIVFGESETFKSNDIGLEVFCGRQFFTVTGAPFPNTKPEVAQIGEAVLRRLKLTVAEAKGQRPAGPVAPPASSSDRAELEGALLAISPDLGYDDWISIGMALQAELGEGGFGLWDYWSSRGSKYPGSDALRGHWRSFKPGGGITSATIFAFALQAGWKKPRRAKPPTQTRDPELAQADGEARTRKDGPNDADWPEKLRRNDGIVRNTVANADLIMRHDEPLKGLLAYDEFSYRIVKRRAPPWPGGHAGPWEETDATKAAVWIERRWGIAVKSKIVDELARAIAWDARYNSVREWLDALPRWDGIERLPSLLADAFGCEQNDYTAHAGTSMLVTAVARIFRPGCKVDTMIVLEGGQGLGKSTAVQELFSPAWYVDIIDPPSHKDFYITLQGAWCVEVAEMQAFGRAEVTQVKQAITRRNDKFRAPYDKFASDHPRQSIFIGTTNADGYLQDPTGARRFLPVRCAHANLEYLSSMREQLFAEAVALFRDGFKWWSIPHELAKREQDQRYVEDSWSEPIETWLDGRSKPVTARYPDPFDVCSVRMADVRPPGEAADAEVIRVVTECTTTDIMRYALMVEIAKHTRQDQMRVANIMRRLGWDRSDLKRLPGTTRSFSRPWLRPPDVTTVTT